MAKRKKSNRSTRAAKKSSPKRKGSRGRRREDSLPPADRDPVIRAIVASARCLGPENPLLFDAIRWCITRNLYLNAVYGSDDEMLRACMQSYKDHGSKGFAKRVYAIVEKYMPGDVEACFESTLRLVERRLELKPERVQVNDQWDDDRSFMEPILEHLEEEPVSEEMRKIARANGLLLDWYV